MSQDSRPLPRNRVIALVAAHRRRFGRSFFSGFRRSQSGTAFVEFALLLPFLILLFLGSEELTRYVTTTRRVTAVANSIAQMLSVNTTGTIGDPDFHMLVDSTMITFPDSLPNATRFNNYWWQAVSISISSINFTASPSGCTSGCSYTAKTMWSIGGGRPCMTPLTAVSDSARPSPTTLPTDVFGPGTLIAVDVNYTYNPIVAPQVFGSAAVMPIARSFYIQPRYVSKILYSGFSATQCSSY